MKRSLSLLLAASLSIAAVSNVHAEVRAVYSFDGSAVIEADDAANNICPENLGVAKLLTFPERKLMMVGCWGIDEKDTVIIIWADGSVFSIPATTFKTASLT